jgi:hypothetical protein
VWLRASKFQIFKLCINLFIRSYSGEIRAAFSDDGPSDASRAALKPTQTVSRLMKIIKDGKFESGLRIDYFDEQTE